MNDAFVEETCKIGKGAECCRYLMMGPDGFECAKIKPHMKDAIDARAHEMKAKGDNCPGYGVDK